MNSSKDPAHFHCRSYCTGFALCLILTLASYFIVSNHLLSNDILLFTLAGLALLQATVQLIFFLHLAKESHPKWNVWSFYSMLAVVLILVVGSLWIMYHLNSRMMPSC